MAVKKPLVLGDDGFPQQLQAGDTIDGSGGGASIVPATMKGSGGNAGEAVYASGNDEVTLADGVSPTGRRAIGLLAEDVLIDEEGSVVTSGPLTLTTGQWDTVTGGAGGLSFGVTYFVDCDNPGKLTFVLPADPGDNIVVMGVAISSTTMIVTPREPVAV